MIEYQKQNRADIIATVLGQIDKKLPTTQIELFKQFIQDYYASASIDILTSYLPTDLYGAAIHFYRFASERSPNSPNVRAYNPHLKENGWESTHTVIDVICNDMPFIVDSLRIEINRQGYNVHNLIHFGEFIVERDKKNSIVKILGRNKPHEVCTVSEAVVHIEIDRQTDAAELKKLEDGIRSVLTDITAAVKDWQPMRNKVQVLLEELTQHPPVTVDKEDIEETQAFLRWIKDDNFTFLGCRDYHLIQQDGEPALELASGTGLGVLRNETYSKKIRLLSDISPEVKTLILSPKQTLILTKTNTLATIHRRVYTDYIGIKKYNAQGDVIGETRIIGLYTTVAYNSHPSQIPFLGHKVDAIIKKSGLPPKGHAGKDLLNILETLPRDDLFHASVNELFDLSMGILQLQERKVVRLFVRKDIYNRFISCLVYVPRDDFNSDVREAIQAILVKRFSAIESSFDTRFSESILARIHFILRIDSHKQVNFSAEDINKIERELIDVSRTWKDVLKDNLIDYYGEEKGMSVFRDYGNTFPAAYREDFHPRNAVHDIVHLKNLSPKNPLEMAFYRLPDDTDTVLRFKLFHIEHTIPLSDVVPMLENMGLRVIGERPYQISGKDSVTAWINDFTMQSSTDEIIDLDISGHLFQEAFAKVWYGLAENDGFNKLVLGAQLNWRQVVILRAYAKYFRQTGFIFSQSSIETTLAQYPKAARYLILLFELSFKVTKNNITDQVVLLEKNIHDEIEKVKTLDEDRILRRYLDVIHATLRTNYYLDKSYLSLKLNPHMIPELPLPLPLYEVFVYSPRFEAVHLRMDKVARGGIRWSDRPQDFRTEVLGLAKAQKVKNSVIVPSGAKGGFVPKCLPVDGTREDIMAEVIRCYEDFMRGLLDITDNIVQGNIVKPHNITCFDEADPYLVVAADKGTASFSDIANAISKEYQFWLGDAFASGGSVGYDHKKMAITARGAWESVKRHFRELNIDIENNDFTVVGIGDMSGDVFGNGMLLSKHIKLLAAFDNRNIFVDPNPDPVKSLAERQRLFDLPRSSWEDYNSELLSKGGMIFKRSAKSLTLTPEIQACFNIPDQTQIAPDAFIKILLTSEVDLLWNGGIGTYVKASTERHADIGDRANDFLRVNGNELKCKAIGEGGNLGCSQLGRVEYALAGGRCNTDFIDNSAGVDCSDHEVNLKILLNEVVANNDMTEKQRNTLLVDMTQEVAELVLKDNYQQTLTISLSLVHAKTHAELYRRYLNDQEKAGLIDRELEFLPSDKELVERKVQGISLTRPELAVLISYSKINIKAALLASTIPEDTYLSKIILTAFPETLQKKFRDNIFSHRLRREIIATQLSSHLVDQMGPVFVYRVQDETGASIPEIIMAYNAAYEIFKIKALYKLINNLNPHISTDIQTQMLLHIKRLVRRGTRWLLRNRRSELDVERCVEYFSTGVAILIDVIPNLMVGVTKEYMDTLTAQFIEAGLSIETAMRIAGCRAMYTALNIVDLATKNNFDIVEAAQVFFAVGANLELAWFRDQLNLNSLEDYWDSIARASLRDDLDVQQRAMTISILNYKKDNKNMKNMDKRIAAWLLHYEPLLQRWLIILANMRSAASLSFIMFYVAVRELSDLTSIILQSQGE